MEETKLTMHELLEELLEDVVEELHVSTDDSEEADTADLLEAVVNKTLLQILSGELAFENAAEFQQTVHTATHYLEGRNV